MNLTLFETRSRGVARIDDCINGEANRWLIVNIFF